MRKLFTIVLLFSANILFAQKVGINKATPAEALDVNGNINVDGVLKVNGTQGAAGQVLISNGSTMQWGTVPGGSSNTWTKAPGVVYNDTNRIGIGVTNPKEKVVIGDTGALRMVIGHVGGFNAVESGRLVFSEDVNFSGGTCGFEMHHNGQDNILSIVSGCTSLLDTSVVFTRQGYVRMPRSLRVGDNLNPTADLHIKQMGTGTTPGGSGLMLENEPTSETNQLWTDGTNLNFARNGNRISFINNLGAYNQVSDKRMKMNIVNMAPVLNTVMMLNPVKYNYNYKGADNQDVFGFIAQDVEKIFPTMVGKTPGSDLLALPYAEFSVVAIKAIQEQQQLINEQAEKISIMEARLSAIEALLGSQANK